LTVTLFLALALGNVWGALIAPRHRVMALLLGGAAIFAPLFVSRDWPVFRTVAAFATAASYLRVVQVARDSTGTTPESRVLSVVTLVIDPRRVASHRVPRRLDVVRFAVATLEIGVAVCVFLSPYPKTFGLVRMAAGATSAYFIVEGMARLMEALCALAGLDPGPLHDAPIRARTVGEFWGRRWNRAVSIWLGEQAFRPAAKRFGAPVGVLAAFGASALLHAVPVWIALDVRHAVPMGAFFLLHGGIVLLESKLRVQKWAPALGHLWTVGVFAVTLPLFAEPLLASLGR
jgi:hypothetical protein